MNWEALGTIAEIIGAIAVVASLVYLSIQVRENTKLAAEKTVASAIDAFTDHSRLIASTPDLASLLLHGEDELSSLSPEELLRFGHLISIELSIYESWYEKSHRVRGGPEHDELMKVMLIGRLSKPGIMELWRSSRGEYTPSFAEWVDSIYDPKGVKRIFFYGLFMDANLLQQLGLQPTVIGLAKLPDFRIFIGDRATLIPSPGSTSCGIIMDLPDDEATSLYAGEGVRDYRPETVTTIMMADGSLQEALCYNLPADASGSEKNVEYAEKLASLVLKLGFSPSYADEIFVERQL